MTVANPAVPTSPQSRARRARLAAAVQPVLAGPSTSAVAVGAGAAGDVACVTLANSLLRLDVAPSLGGGITRFDFRNEGTLVPVFRRCRHVDADTDANDLACYSLLPYSNRIGGGQFKLGERSVDVPCNREGEPLPIHGDGRPACHRDRAGRDPRVGDARRPGHGVIVRRRRAAPSARGR